MLLRCETSHTVNRRQSCRDTILRVFEEDKAKIKNSTAFSEADRKKLIEFDEEDNPLLIVLK